MTPSQRAAEVAIGGLVLAERWSDEQWAAIEPRLPKNRLGARRVDDQRVISGILHVLKTGCRWATAIVADQSRPLSLLQTLCQRFVDRGKPHQVALVACARKLLIFANTVVARGTPWIQRPIAA